MKKDNNTQPQPTPGEVRINGRAGDFAALHIEPRDGETAEETRRRFNEWIAQTPDLSIGGKTRGREWDDILGDCETLHKTEDEMRRVCVPSVFGDGGETYKEVWKLARATVDLLTEYPNNQEAIKEKINEVVCTMYSPTLGLPGQIIYLSILHEYCRESGEYTTAVGAYRAAAFADWIGGILAEKVNRFYYYQPGKKEIQRMHQLWRYLNGTQIGQALRESVDGSGEAPREELPTVYDTEREKKYFTRAIKAGFMERDGGGYKWNWGNNATERGGTARLGYFLSRVYVKERPQDQRPRKQLETLFGGVDLSAAISRAEEKPTDECRSEVRIWREEIDRTIFYD